MDIHNVIIIGAGPAGISAAIQLKRHMIEPVVLEQEEIGGLLRNANEVENYPGFPGGISGVELVKRFREHLDDAGIKVCFERVLDLNFRDELFVTETDKRTIRSDYAVIAAGTKPKENLDFRISDDMKDRFFHEVYPIRGIKNKRITIIGAGDAAFDYALNLSRNNTVTILSRGPKTRCIPVLYERCSESENILYRQNTKVNEIQSEGASLLVRCSTTDISKSHSSDDRSTELTVNADYVIAATGREPCLDFLNPELKKSVDMPARIDKLYMAGDVKNDRYRQTAICVGDGVRAAMEINRHYGEQSHENKSQNGN